MRRWVAACLAAACVALSGCGGGEGDVVGGQELYPTSTGSKWEYQVTTADGATTTTEKMIREVTGPVESEPGAVEFEEVTESGEWSYKYRWSTSSSLRESRMARNAGAYAATILLMKFPVVTGDEYARHEDMIADVWVGYGTINRIITRSHVIVAGREAVDTAVGAFVDAVRFRTVTTVENVTTGQTQTDVDDAWYSAGVGLVKSRVKSTSGSTTTTINMDLRAYSVDGRSAGTFSPVFVD